MHGNVGAAGGAQRAVGSGQRAGHGSSYDVFYKKKAFVTSQNLRGPPVKAACPICQLPRQICPICQLTRQTCQKSTNCQGGPLGSANVRGRQSSSLASQTGQFHATGLPRKETVPDRLYSLGRLQRSELGTRKTLCPTHA